jgi:hypothetical protein
VVEGSRLSAYFLHFSRRLLKGAVTLGATGNSISGEVVRRQCVLVFDWHRLLLTGSRWDIRWVSGGRKKSTLCVFPVFLVAVMEKCCDAWRDGEYYLRWGGSASVCAGV